MHRGARFCPWLRYIKPVMGTFFGFLKHIVAAIWLGAAICLPAGAAPGNLAGNLAGDVTDDMAGLMQALKAADDASWRGIEDQIRARWERSGSASMDLLLKRGRDAIEAGKMPAAIDHLSALVDHAPDFLEGYEARARAYFQAGMYGPALADIGHVLARDPNRFDAMTGLAVILEDLNEPQKALVVYRRVLSLHPHKPDALKAAERLEKTLSGSTL